MTRMAPGESSKLLGKDSGSGDLEHSLFVSETKEFRNNDAGFVFLFGFKRSCVFIISQDFEKTDMKE